MTDYISREAAIEELCKQCENLCEGFKEECGDYMLLLYLPAADVREVVFCKDCKHNNACLTQVFVEDESRVPFDRNTFFCADGKREEQT